MQMQQTIAFIKFVFGNVIFANPCSLQNATSDPVNVMAPMTVPIPISNSEYLFIELDKTTLSLHDA
jgi:hypothetical protein